MNPRWRFVIVLLIVIFAAAWCGSRVRAQDHARPRSGGGQGHGQSGQRSQPSHAQPRQHDNQRRGDTEHRQQQGTRDNRGDRAQRGDAQGRHPQPGYDNRGGRSDGNRGRYQGRQDNDRYNWRNYGQHQRWDRDRFPRRYYGISPFNRHYRGRGFGPHYGMWYRNQYNTWGLFYWPYAYEPLFGCGWYWVPRERQLIVDEYTGEEYWDYSDYGYLYLCFD
jgi:hypothetical protein